MNQPILHNTRIIDFTWVLAGPYATRLLADYGAEVIKVLPVYATMPEDPFERGYYNTWNRNKLGITLNMEKPQGVELAKRLVSISDVVAENFTPRVMANWGMDYDSLVKIKPDIIVLGMSAMGQTGPQRDFVGFGPTVQALSGLTALTGFPGRSPLGLGFSYADHVAGLYASLAVLGALEHRQKTGEGQYIDLSQTEAMMSLLGGAVMDADNAVPQGNRAAAAAPHNVYRCRGGEWCAVTVFTGEEWQGFKHALGNPAWAEETRFATLAARLENVEELDRLVTGWTERRTAAEAMACLQGHGVAAGVVQDAVALLGSKQLRERGFFVKMEQPGGDEVLTDAVPIKLPEARPVYRRAAPAIGQDNEYVFRKLLGMSGQKIVELRENGVI